VLLGDWGSRWRVVHPAWAWRREAMGSVLTCLWHWNFLFRSHDLPQVTEFKLQGKKERYLYTMAVEFKATKLLQYMSCKDWSISQELMMFMS